MMNNLNKIDQSDLDKIILILVNKYKIDRIFLNTYYAVDIPFYELVILLSNKEHKSVGELDPQIKMSLKDFPKFHHVTLVGFQVKSKLIDGNLYLHMSCHPDKLIYEKSSSTFELYPEDHCAEKTLAAVKNLFEREDHKVQEFKEGYYYFKERGALSHAGFMLHQALELRYRCMEILVMGKERATHSIRSHHRYLLRMASALDTIFKEGKPEDEILLQFLEDIYRAARYEDDFDVDLDVLLKLQERMEIFMKHTDAIFQESVMNFTNYSLKKEREAEVLEITNNSVEETGYCHYTEEHPVSKPEKSKKLESIIARLKEILDIRGIYIFGHRSRSFTIDSINQHDSTGICEDCFSLLLVTDSDIRDQVGNIQASINEEPEISVLLLSYTFDQIQKQLDRNSPFFHRALQHIDPLYASENNMLNWKFHPQNGQRTPDEMSEALAKWQGRKNNASRFYNAGEAIEHSKDLDIKAFLYNQAIEQACLGILEYLYNYTPYQHNLKHLYTLCASLWQFPNDIFPRNTKEEKSLLDQFAQTVKDIRYQGWSMGSCEQVDHYAERCDKFINACSDLIPAS